ncbi:MAG: diguanylate cyclase [Candidatus Brocadia sp.]
MIFAQLFDMVDIGIVVLNKDLKVYKWNRWMELHSRITTDKIIGHCIFDFFPNLNNQRFLKSCKSVLTFGNFCFFSQKLHGYLFAFKLVTSLGSKFEYMQQNSTMGPLRDENNSIQYIYITVQDVTEIAIYEQKLLEMNTMDSLTGIYNRRFLEARLKDEFERHRRYSRHLSLIMLDIDFFKKINDAYGHQCGDFIIKSLALQIASIIRKTDIFARYGGEEFCCILPETNLNHALDLAEKLREAVANQNYNYRDLSINVTISLGVAELQASDPSPDFLLKKADDALYEAKRMGRNKIVAINESESLYPTAVV